MGSGFESSMSACAIIVTDQRLLPPWGGNRVRILGVIRSLRDSGWRVFLVTSQFDVGEELQQLVDEVILVHGRSFQGGEVRGFDVGPFRKAVSKAAARIKPSVVLAEYAWLAPSMMSLPKEILRCIDCHDILSERTERFRAAGLDPWAACSREYEIALLSCADIVIAAQYSDRAKLKKLLKGKRVLCLLPPIELPPNFSRTSPDSSIVLAVGAKHAGNLGIHKFAASPWTTVLKRRPQASMHIVGGIGAGPDAGPKIETYDAVKDLDRHYAAAAVVVCPIEIGTGVKIKMLEAIRYGKAVVATESAAEGLPLQSDPAWLTVGTLSECADSVATLLEDRGLRSRLEHAAFAYGDRHLSPQRAAMQIRSILPGHLRRCLAAFAG